MTLFASFFNLLYSHSPALLVIIPLLSAAIIALIRNKNLAYMFTSLSAMICLCLSFFLYFFPEKTIMNYVFGGWKAPFGIEYRLDYLNIPIIIYLNCILTFLLIFNKELIEASIIKYIDLKSQHLFYSLLLFAHTGYIGVLCTNDIFNIYVFIEISSLATYVLMSKGNNPRGLIGAFDYLILGTIGATFILISIGFILNLTGSLNISDIANILISNPPSNIAILAITFFIIGTLLKIAFFPMHFWMIRAYTGVAPIILTYSAAISSIFGIYLMMRFIQFTIHTDTIYELLILIIRPMAMFTIMICSYSAIRSHNFKEVIIYSTSAQIGYILLLLTIIEARNIMFQFIILDGLNKIALFSMIAHYENHSRDLSFKNFKFIANNASFKIMAAIILLFSAAMPITSMFLVKVKIFDLLILNNLFIELGIIIIGSFISVLYHFKLMKALFFTPQTNGIIHINTGNRGLLAIIIVQLIILPLTGNIWFEPLGEIFKVY